MSDKSEKRIKRHKRVRARIKGAPNRPRVSVFRSNKHVWAQLIDDVSGRTLAFASDIELSKSGKGGTKKSASSGSKSDGGERIAERIGELLAEKASKIGISSAVFDRGGYKYHGTIKSVAEGIRKSGLKI